MSNAERWDHSGFNELISEDKNNNYKRGVGNKKNFYKLKDNNSMQNDKLNAVDYMDHSQSYKKNQQIKKSMIYPNNKYNNEDWDSEKAREGINHEYTEGGSNYKNKFKKKKKGEGEYPENSEKPDYYKKDERIINNNYSTNNYSNQNNMVNNNINSNNYLRGKKNNNQGYTGNLPYNPNNPMYYSNNHIGNNSNKTLNMNPNNYQNFNNYISQSPYNQQPTGFNTGKGTPSHYQTMGSNNSLGVSNNNIKNDSTDLSVEDPNQGSKIMIDDLDCTNIENELLQQNNLISNDLKRTTSGEFQKKKRQQGTVDGGKIDEKNYITNTPKRDSMNFPSNTTSNTSGVIGSQTPGNSVGYSPQNEQIFMNNILKIPTNNYNFNSPVRQMNDNNFVYPSYPNSRGPIPMNNMNPPFYNMMGGMTPMMIDGNMHPIPNNFNPNYGSYTYTHPNHGPMMKGPINPNNMHNKPIDPYKYNSTPSNPGEDSMHENRRMSNGNNNMQRGSNSGIQNMYSPFERANNMNINQQQHNKKGMNYNNNFINNNINVNNLNYNQMNKNFNRKMNNNQFQMNGIQPNPLHRMKFIKSDKNILQSQNSFKSSQPGSSENLDTIMNQKQSGNKVWRDMKNSNGNLDALTNIINNTIRNSHGNQNNLKSSAISYNSFGSIKEEAKKARMEENNHSDYFSSEHSEYSVAEEEIISENKIAIITLSIKIDGRYEQISINSTEDIHITIKRFILKNQLSERLIRPLTDKVKFALSSIDCVLHTHLVDNHFAFDQIKEYYKSTKEKEENIIPDLDLSCITYFDNDTHEPDDLTLSADHYIENLNRSQ